MNSEEFIYLWKFSVLAGKQNEFEKLYGADGEWVELFKKHPGYISTQLLKSTESEFTYVTIDRWKSKEDMEDFKLKFKNEFEALDKKGELLTDNEKFIGDFIIVG
ncbi:MAG: antibiotic biosynthesis monooxygenase [Ignavibacteriales bacterium]|nr:MAG: antibiotic biosynthesis monooxygenase [Ignavibacteriales bacterium]